MSFLYLRVGNLAQAESFIEEARRDAEIRSAELSTMEVTLNAAALMLMERSAAMHTSSGAAA